MIHTNEQNTSTDDEDYTSEILEFAVSNLEITFDSLWEFAFGKSKKEENNE